MFLIYWILKVLFFTRIRPCISFFFTVFTPAKIEPSGDLVKYVGESFSLTCSAISLNTTPTTFLRNGQAVSNIQRVDSSTIKLDIKNATRSDSGDYICLGIKNDSLSSLAIKNVLVAYPLEAPVFMTCINYNGRSMNCSFKLTRDPDEMLFEHVNISYSIGNANVLYVPRDQITIINRTINCEWKSDDTNIGNMFSNKLKHNVKMTLYSRKDTITTDYTIDPYIYVKPEPVKKLDVIFNTSRTHFTSIVKWSPPLNQDACQTGNLVYNISIVRNDMITLSNKIEPVCSKQNLSLLIKDLAPYTRYIVKITCKPVNDGYWSEKAQIHITTPITAPENGPKILENFYTTVINPDGSRKVAVYWQDYKLDEQGGPINNYIIRIPTLYKSRLIPGNVRSVTLDLPPKKLAVHVQATTKAGSSPYSTLVIPAQYNGAPALVSTDVIVEKWNGTSYEITCEKLSDLQSIKIYYCHGRLSSPVLIVQCLTALRTPILSYNVNGAFVTIPDTSSGRCKDCEVYFAVSMNTNITNSGLIWSVCYFVQFGDAAEPVFSVTVNVDSILMKWQQVCDRTKARPTLLQLSYQQYRYNTTNCVEGITVNISREQTQHTIKGLNPGTKYMLCLRTITELKSSEWVMKNITTSPIVTESEVDYVTIFLPIALFSLILVPLICICVCKIRRLFKRSYTVKHVRAEKSEYTAYDEIEEGNGIIEEGPQGINRSEEVPLNSLTTEASPPDSNNIDGDPLDDNRREEKPIGSNRTDEVTLNSLATETNPLDSNHIDRDPLNNNRTEANPVESNSGLMESERILHSHRIESESIDQNNVEAGPIDRNDTNTDPLTSNHIEAIQLDSNLIADEPLNNNSTSTNSYVSGTTTSYHIIFLSESSGIPIENNILDDDYIRVDTTSFNPYTEHTFHNGHCRLSTEKNSGHVEISNGYEQHSMNE